MWRCKECGGEIEAKINIFEQVRFSINKDGDIDELTSSFSDSIDDMIKNDIDNYLDTYFCKNCDNESTDLNDIAEWVEE